MEDPTSSGDPVSILLNLLLLGFLLYLSGVFSGTETALMSMGKLKLRDLVDSKEKRFSKSVKFFVQNPNSVLTAILVMNNVVNILSSSLATLLALQVLPDNSAGVAAALVTGIMTFLILIFGEITPKIYARENSERLFRRTITFISAITIVLKPILWLLLRISSFFIIIIGGKKAEFSPFITEDEIKSAVDAGHKEGVLQSEERMIMKRTLELKDISVKEIMTPRVEIVALEEEQPLIDLMELVQSEGYSRYPIYRENIDRIVGVCYAKDLLNFILDRKDNDVLQTIRVEEIMRYPYFVPETKKVDDLLREFKEKKNHLAVVIDEYGGTAGIITMEDVIEELTGEILDEYDEESEEIMIERLGEREYIVDGMTPINDIERELEQPFPETEFETIGGYLLEVLERFPEVGEKIIVDGFTFEVLAAGKNKVEKIRLIVDRRSVDDRQIGGEGTNTESY
ncbi:MULTISPECIES: hemolysin family protein [Mesotoga]|uniref:hemolysin family protein n=1 Tax=Mesotoga TaxID=1184396 RepID=UPI00039CA293|nr:MULTISPECIES: hemolysin family protein [Mesotoga]MCP5456356.1 HlyC/CorC family transporter [Thermotogota bacterium]MCP5460919.1 HlyC/CorC family transporter [Thermotogota bacterium]RLL88237.1 hemolysin [Mesotoga sp. H07pep.5.4]HNQ70386.1 hemolysin family protein [Mesotoga prima]HNS75163.1 hemolysin family protein [Mesotoga prima]